MIDRGGNDPSLGAFLEFLTEQMEAQPHLIRGLTSLERAEALVDGVEVGSSEDLGEDTTLD